ncbi:hypothetical protein SAMN05421780_10595 [Flexibacter flexilis DSM 6793]|uniref:Uncharacterized protein n=1 Tax=Flexibacter flexilis DSM 6793 TaxID=927664 RepID=A0A1I1IU70_9BACT|nr:hypothetical protein SAMN05421780_10595 [Flexibacter flexilis DSM 6793]
MDLRFVSIEFTEQIHDYPIIFYNVNKTCEFLCEM